MQVVQGQLLVQVGVEHHYIGVAAHGDGPLLGVHPQDLGGVGGGNGGEPLQGDTARRDQLGVSNRQPGLDAVMAAADRLDGVSGQLDVFVGGVLVGGRGAQGAVGQSFLQSVPVLGVLDGRIGMDGRATGLFIVFAGELQVVVQGFAVNRLLLGTGLGDGRHSFLGRGVHEINAHLRVVGQPQDLAKSDVFRDVVVHQMQVIALVPAFPLKLLFHVGDDVVVFGVYGHDAPVVRHLLENILQVAVGAPGGIEGGEYLEAGHPRLDSLADLADGFRGHCPGHDVVESEVGIGMAGKGVAALFHLLHDGVCGWGFPRGDGQVAGEVDEGGDAAKGRRPAGCFGRLGDNLGAARPHPGHRNTDVGVRFDSAGQDDFARRVDDSEGFYVQGTGPGHGGYNTTLNADVQFGDAFGGHYPSAANNQVQHRCPPGWLC